MKHTVWLLYILLCCHGIAVTRVCAVAAVLFTCCWHILDWVAAEDVPIASRQCNTAACPQQALQVLASAHSSCGRGCTLLGSELDGGQLVCINSLG
jgi:hypothetical protein